MRDRTEWIVIRTGPTVPAGVMRFECLRCGDTNDLPLPCSASDVSAKSRAFAQRHGVCPAPAPVVTVEFGAGPHRIRTTGGPRG